eukprot:g3005.t1
MGDDAEDGDYYSSGDDGSDGSDDEGTSFWDMYKLTPSTRFPLTLATDKEENTYVTCQGAVYVIDVNDQHLKRYDSPFAQTIVSVLVPRITRRSVQGTGLSQERKEELARFAFATDKEIFVHDIPDASRRQITDGAAEEPLWRIDICHGVDDERVLSACLTGVSPQHVVALTSAKKDCFFVRKNALRRARVKDRGEECRWGEVEEGSDNLRMFSKPDVICGTPAGEVVVSDAGRRQINLYSLDGEFLKHWASPARDDCVVKSICVDNWGRLIIAESPSAVFVGGIVTIVGPSGDVLWDFLADADERSWESPMAVCCSLRSEVFVLDLKTARAFPTILLWGDEDQEEGEQQQSNLADRLEDSAAAAKDTGASKGERGNVKHSGSDDDEKYSDDADEEAENLDSNNMRSPDLHSAPSTKAETLSTASGRDRIPVPTRISEEEMKRAIAKIRGKLQGSGENERQMLKSELERGLQGGVERTATVFAEMPYLNLSFRVGIATKLAARMHGRSATLILAMLLRDFRVHAPLFRIFAKIAHVAQGSKYNRFTSTRDPNFLDQMMDCDAVEWTDSKRAAAAPSASAEAREAAKRNLHLHDSLSSAALESVIFSGATGGLHLSNHDVTMNELDVMKFYLDADAAESYSAMEFSAILQEAWAESKSPLIDVEPNLEAWSSQENGRDFSSRGGEARKILLRVDRCSHLPHEQGTKTFCKIFFAGSAHKVAQKDPSVPSNSSLAGNEPQPRRREERRVTHPTFDQSFVSELDSVQMPIQVEIWRKNTSLDDDHGAGKLLGYALLWRRDVRTSPEEPCVPLQLYGKGLEGRAKVHVDCKVLPSFADMDNAAATIRKRFAASALKVSTDIVSNILSDKNVRRISQRIKKERRRAERERRRKEKLADATIGDEERATVKELIRKLLQGQQIMTGADKQGSGVSELAGMTLRDVNGTKLRAYLSLYTLALTTKALQTAIGQEMRGTPLEVALSDLNCRVQRIRRAAAACLLALTQGNVSNQKLLSYMYGFGMKRKEGMAGDLHIFWIPQELRDEYLKAGAAHEDAALSSRRRQRRVVWWPASEENFFLYLKERLASGLAQDAKEKNEYEFGEREHTHAHTVPVMVTCYPPIPTFDARRRGWLRDHPERTTVFKDIARRVAHVAATGRKGVRSGKVRMEDGRLQFSGGDVFGRIKVDADGKSRLGDIVNVICGLWDDHDVGPDRRLVSHVIGCFADASSGTGQDVIRLEAFIEALEKSELNRHDRQRSDAQSPANILDRPMDGSEECVVSESREEDEDDDDDNDDEEEENEEEKQEKEQEYGNGDIGPDIDDDESLTSEAGGFDEAHLLRWIPDPKHHMLAFTVTAKRGLRGPSKSSSVSSDEANLRNRLRRIFERFERDEFGRVSLASLTEDPFFITALGEPKVSALRAFFKDPRRNITRVSWVDICEYRRFVAYSDLIREQRQQAELLKSQVTQIHATNAELRCRGGAMSSSDGMKMAKKAVRVRIFFVPQEESLRFDVSLRPPDGSIYQTAVKLEQIAAMLGLPPPAEDSSRSFALRLAASSPVDDKVVSKLLMPAQTNVDGQGGREKEEEEEEVEEEDDEFVLRQVCDGGRPVSFSYYVERIHDDDGKRPATTGTASFWRPLPTVMGLGGKPARRRNIARMYIRCSKKGRRRPRASFATPYDLTVIALQLGEDLWELGRVDEALKAYQDAALVVVKAMPARALRSAQDSEGQQRLFSALKRSKILEKRDSKKRASAAMVLRKAFEMYRQDILKTRRRTSSGTDGKGDESEIQKQLRQRGTGKSRQRRSLNRKLFQTNRKEILSEKESQRIALEKLEKERALAKKKAEARAAMRKQARNAWAVLDSRIQRTRRMQDKKQKEREERTWAAESQRLEQVRSELKKARAAKEAADAKAAREARMLKASEARKKTEQRRQRRLKEKEERRHSKGPAQTAVEANVDKTKQLLEFGARIAKKRQSLRRQFEAAEARVSTGMRTVAYAGEEEESNDEDVYDEEEFEL